MHAYLHTLTLTHTHTHTHIYIDGFMDEWVAKMGHISYTQRVYKARKGQQ